MSDRDYGRLIWAWKGVERRVTTRFGGFIEWIGPILWPYRHSFDTKLTKFLDAFTGERIQSLSDFAVRLIPSVITST